MVSQFYNEAAIEFGIANLAQPLRFAGSTTIIAAAAGDYAAGNVISNSSTDTTGVPNRANAMSRTTGGCAILQGIRAVCGATSGLVVAPIRLYWFAYPPTPTEVEMDDRAAFAINTLPGGNKYVGSTLLNGFVDRGAVSVSDTVGIQEALRTAPQDDGLYFVATFEGAEANESAGMPIRFDFYCY